MFFFILVVFPVVLLSLTFLLSAFTFSLTTGLITSGVTALLLLFSIVAYRYCKRAWEWEQGSIMRELVAMRASVNPKPCYLNEQTGFIASLTVAQRNRELAAMTTRTWR